MSVPRDTETTAPDNAELATLLDEINSILTSQRQSLQAGDLQAIQDAMPKVTALLAQAAKQPAGPENNQAIKNIAKTFNALLLSLAAGKADLTSQIQHVNQSRRAVSAYTNR